MFRPIIILAACAIALSGTARARDVSTDPDACVTFCANKAGTDAQKALVRWNPATAVDGLKCFCNEKAIFSEVQSCIELACPVFKDNLKSGCDELHDALSGDAGATIHGGISLLVVPSAVIVGTLLL